MYGLVNRAIEELICEHHGPEVWERVKADSGVDDDAFISNQAYDDQITYALVGAASRVLGRGADEILEAFGRHWVLKTARESYGPMLDATGRSLPEFLEHLPNLHTRVTLVFPKLNPPQFRVEREAERRMLVYYTSHRAGLESFVVGLLHGLCSMFGATGEVELVQARSSADEPAVFRLSWTDGQP